MNPQHPLALPPVLFSGTWLGWKSRFSLYQGRYIHNAQPSPCRLFMLAHLNELGMGAGGKEGIAFEGSFRFKGCRSGSWSGVPMTKMTTEDDNNVCELRLWWNGKITPADSLSAAMKAAQGEVWLSSKCIGMWGLETYCFFLSTITLCLFVWFHFLPFPIYLCLRERHRGEVPHLTPWKRLNWGHWEHDGKVQTLCSYF